MALPRVLFISQGVSLAHVGRPAALAEALVTTQRFSVHFARTTRMARFVAIPGVTMHTVEETLSPEKFVSRLATGKPLFDHATLEADLREDLRLFEEVKPDLVVGDLRLSLQVSARLNGIPFASLTNAHWSPNQPMSSYPLPDHPLAKVLGRSLATKVFQTIAPFVFRQQVSPVNALRKRHGLAPVTEMRHGYHDADELLFADEASFFPGVDRGTFLGPIVWEPPVATPSWLNSHESSNDLAFLSIGSTGSTKLLASGVLDAIRSLGLRVMLATAERGEVPEGVLAAPFVPGLKASRRARVVVCNGGSGTLAQALAAGRPFLAICSNMDQFLASQPLVEAGAGLLLPASQATSANVTKAMRQLLHDDRFAKAAWGLQAKFHPALAPTRFINWAEHMTRASAAA